MKKLLLFFPFLLILLQFSSKNVSATTLFQDNFDDNDISDWTVVRNAQNDNRPGTCYYNGTTATWIVENKKLGIRINGEPCSTEIVPNQSTLDNLVEYVFEFDMDFPNTINADRNFLIKWKDPANWIGLKFYGNGVYYQKVVGGQGYGSSTSYIFESGKTYHFKCVVTNNLKRIFINNNLFWEINDYYPSFVGGIIGFQASVGSDPDSEVWFDNVRVCSADDPCGDVTPIPTPTPTSIPTPTSTLTPTPQIPIVFIPGLGGSINFKEMFLGIDDQNGWKMTPGANVYNNLIKGFEGNPNFHVFYYDWRKSVLDSAQKLNDFIKNTVQPPDNKVYLIGHSLGGLVGRTCIQKTANNCYAEKLITVGSPHLGVVDVYPAIEAGEIWRTGPMKLGFEIMLHYFQQPGETRKETLNRIAPVIHELLPNFDYLKRDSQIIHWGSLPIQNTLLPQLANQITLENKTTTLYGMSFPTLRFLNVADPNWIDKVLGNWNEGKPESKEFDDGDGTVLSLSSVINNSLIDKFSFNLNHGGIISEKSALEKIFQILNLDLPEASYNSLLDDENYLVFFVHSPVKITLSNLPENSYATDEMVVVPNPKNKNYNLNLEGIKADYYQLSVGQIISDKSYWNDYLGKTTLGQNQTMNFNINLGNPQKNPLIDQGGTINNELLITRIEEFKKEINELKINKIFQKTLINTLDKLLKEKSFSKLTSLRQTIAVYENNHIIGSEIAVTFRKKCSDIANILEYLTFLNPKQINKSQALSSIFETEGIKNSIPQNKLKKSSALVFLEAMEKLDLARNNFSKGDYFRTKIFANEARDLFVEVKIIK